MNQLSDFFPTLSAKQIQQFNMLPELYSYWNEKINVISRKDIDNLFINHILHSLTLCKFVQFTDGAKVLDLGTGGGFPAIPLSIFFPEAFFTAIDGTGKKIKVVNEIANAIQIDNLKALHVRAENYKEKFHFVVSRAVAELQSLYLWSKPLILNKPVQALPNGLIAYKGGNIADEVSKVQHLSYLELWNISEKFDVEYFNDKVLVYVQK